jgi:hypothetical protein
MLLAFQISNIYMLTKAYALKVPSTDSEGTEHAVEVEAESLYDAVGLAIARFHEAPVRCSAFRRARGSRSKFASQ